MAFRAIGNVSFIVVLLLCLGCSEGSNSDLMNLQPLGGRLTYQGQPMAGAIITLHPHHKSLIAGAGTPRAIADGDGRYQLTTFRSGDGAPIGEYRVSIYWPRGGAEPSPLQEVDSLPPCRLNEAYAQPSTSNLTANVQEGDGVLNFILP